MGEFIPNGSGGFILRPGKPKLEVGPSEAARILNCAQSSLTNMLDRPLAQKYIKWRWTSDSHGKRVFDSASLQAYREALADPEVPRAPKMVKKKKG